MRFSSLMRYVLQVKSSMYGGQGASLALQLAKALLASGHQIDQIFFAGDAVYNGNAFNFPANDEVNLMKEWQKLHTTYHIPLNLCVAAAQRRGIVNAESAVDAAQNNLAYGFQLSGLAEFSLALLNADRVISI